MGELLTEFLAADVVVCATPLYYYSMSSRLQTVLERTLPLSKAGFDTTRRGLFRNKTRYPDIWKGKTLIFLVVGALRDISNFKPFENTCRLIAEGLDMELGGVLIRPESHLIGFSRVGPKTARLVRAAFTDAGEAAARLGRIPEKTLRTASMYLSPNTSYFEKHCEIYWEKACEMGSEALDAGKLVAEVSADVRPIFLRMASSMDPVATAKIEAVVQFDFADTDMHFRVAINRGTVEITREKSAAPDLRVSCDAGVWGDIATGKTSPREALGHGLMTLTGDKSLFARLSRFFPVVS